MHAKCRATPEGQRQPEWCLEKDCTTWETTKHTKCLKRPVSAKSHHNANLSPDIGWKAFSGLDHILLLFHITY